MNVYQNSARALSPGNKLCSSSQDKEIIQPLQGLLKPILWSPSKRTSIVSILQKWTRITALFQKAAFNGETAIVPFNNKPTNIKDSLEACRGTHREMIFSALSKVSAMVYMLDT